FYNSSNQSLSAFDPFLWIAFAQWKSQIYDVNINVIAINVDESLLNVRSNINVAHILLKRVFEHSHQLECVSDVVFDNQNSWSMTSGNLWWIDNQRPSSGFCISAQVARRFTISHARK